LAKTKNFSLLSKLNGAEERFETEISTYHIICDIVVAFPSGRPPMDRPGSITGLIAKKYGFLTFPEFVDNFFVKSQKANIKLFLKILRKYEDEIVFAVYPDFRYDLLFLLRKYPDINWIFPLHLKREFKFAKENFEWIGYPHRDRFRDYSLHEFLRVFDNKKKWYLGFFEEKRPEMLLHFDGFDTTLPLFYSHLGKIWLKWNKAIKPRNKMSYFEKFETNVRNFKRAILNLSKMRTLREYTPHYVRQSCFSQGPVLLVLRNNHFVRQLERPGSAPGPELYIGHFLSTLTQIREV